MLPCLSNLHVFCVFLLVGGLIKPYGQLLDPTQQCCILFKSVDRGGMGGEVRTHQARSQDPSWGWGWGWVCVWAVKTQTCRGVGGRGACSPEKVLEILDCLGLHFARFHVGERGCRVLKAKRQLAVLDLLKIQHSSLHG